MTILIMTCSKAAKWLMTCSKLGKWLIIMTCSKLAVLNKAVQGTFLKSQKSKNRLKRHKLRILIYFEKQWQIAIHGTFLSLKKVKKNCIWKLWIHICLWLRKVSWVALFATTHVLPSWSKSYNKRCANNYLLSRGKTISSLLELIDHVLSISEYVLEKLRLLLMKKLLWWKTYTKRCTKSYVISCVKRLSLPALCGWSSTLNFNKCCLAKILKIWR